MPIRTVGVLGCGQMGSGIAQICAMSGYLTRVKEVNQELLDKGVLRVTKVLKGDVAKGKITPDIQSRALDNLQGTTRVEDLADCELIIEAIVENLDDKRQAYAEVEPVVGPATLLVSNTSSLSITELGASTTRPDRFAGLHFFYPVPLMKPVEVIRSLATSEESYRDLFSFAQTIGKEPITAPDRPGFIVNRLLVPYLLDAIRTYENGLGTVEDIDKGMKLGCGHPMGPFTLLDFVGLDTIYFIANIMFDELREARYAPPPLLKRMVVAGRCGRKSGHGFYRYEAGVPAVAPPKRSVAVGQG